MRFTGCHVVVWCCLASFVGCGRGPAPTNDTPTPAASAYQGRLDAAQAIESRSERINALGKIAMDAAKAGDPAAVSLALDKIDEHGKVERDELIERCALSLAKAGKAQDATKVTGRCHEAKARQELLKKIARGEFE